MLIESTYGNRVHPHENSMAELAPALQRSAASDALHWKIEHELGWRARVPDHLSMWPL